MGFGSDEYIDYTLLKKKGLLKIKEEEMKKGLKSEGGFIDFTSFGNNGNSADIQKQESASNTMPNFDFLSNMASVGTTNVSSNPLTNLDSGSSSADSSGLGKDFSALRIKVD